MPSTTADPIHNTIYAQLLESSISNDKARPEIDQPGPSHVITGPGRLREPKTGRSVTDFR